MTIQATIDRINEAQEWDELQIIVEELVPDFDLDEGIFQAIEKRQDELYVPTVKDIAERNLREGLAKQGKNLGLNRKAAIMKQGKINDSLQVAYDSVK